MKRFARFLPGPLCALAALLAVSCADLPGPGTLQKPGTWSRGPLVMTRHGWVQGAEDAEGTLVWKAIPYARPPVGDLRWRAPQPPEPWSGVQDRSAFSNPCTSTAS